MSERRGRKEASDTGRLSLRAPRILSTNNFIYFILQTPFSNYDFTHRWENSSLESLSVSSKEDSQRRHRVMFLNIGVTRHWLSHSW